MFIVCIVKRVESNHINQNLFVNSIISYHEILQLDKMKQK